MIFTARNSRVHLHIESISDGRFYHTPAFDRAVRVKGYILPVIPALPVNYITHTLFRIRAGICDDFDALRQHTINVLAPHIKFQFVTLRHIRYLAFLLRRCQPNFAA